MQTRVRSHEEQRDVHDTYACSLFPPKNQRAERHGLWLRRMMGRRDGPHRIVMLGVNALTEEGSQWKQRGGSPDLAKCRRWSGKASERRRVLR